VPATTLAGHIVLVGHGRVGSYIADALSKGPLPLLIIEDDVKGAERARQRGIEAIAGNAADPNVIAAANLGAAHCLLVAIPDAFEGGQVVEQARRISAALPIIARAHSEAEVEHFKKYGATEVVMSEHEIARAMIADIPPKATVAEIIPPQPA
jgi:CPA2 family monovalent cation:H+ antiporter-2